MTGWERPAGGDETNGPCAASSIIGSAADAAWGFDSVVPFSPADARRCAGMPAPADGSVAARDDGSIAAHDGGSIAPHDGDGESASGGGGFADVSADDRAAVAGALAGARRELAAIRAAIGRLRDVPLWTIAEKDLMHFAGEVEATVRSAYGLQVRLAGEVSERGIDETLSARSAAQLLRQSLRITIGEARGRVAAARHCLPSQTPSGQAIDPPLPHLLDAIDGGALSDHHARIITGCWHKIPPAVDAETRTLCRDLLLDQATQRDPDGLRQVADDIHNIVDPDGSLDGRDPSDRAELHIGTRRGDGLTPYRGLGDPLMIEQLRTAVEALATPKPIDEHTPDPRPAPLRRAQALAEILHRHLTAGAGPRDGGVRPQVVVTVPLRDLLVRLHGTATSNAANGSATAVDAAGQTGGAPHAGPGTCGSAWSDYDGIQTAAMARMLACDAAIIPQVLGSDSVVLDQGRAIRLFTAAQRRAITTRDRGCGFPGCDIPPAWTDAHHITYWSLGGATDTANGVLLCRRHHTEIHLGHWRIRTDPHGGRPWFVPPPHIDPGREPRRNNHFHFPDLLGVVDRR